MDFMTCEQFVIQELNDTRKNVLEMQKSIDEKQEQLCEIRKENAELKDFLNELLSEIEIRETCGGETAMGMNLYEFREKDKELIEKIKKYKQERANVEKTEEKGEEKCPEEKL